MFGRTLDTADQIIYEELVRFTIMFNKESKSRLKIIKQDTGAIVFDKNQGIYFQTNDVGVKILELLSKNESEEEIVSAISVAYSIEIDVAKQDVKDFIQSLKKGGL